MEIHFLTVAFGWCMLSVFSIALILLRNDAEVLIEETKQSFSSGIVYGLLFIVAFIFYAPMTLPYSINYFWERWK